MNIFVKRELNMFDTAVIASSLISALAGGWIGAYLQSRNNHKISKLELLWQFRLKLFEAEQIMWDATDYNTQLQAPLNWLRVAATDPRINIPLTMVESYVEAINSGYRNRTDREEEEGMSGIYTFILEEVRDERLKIDELILGKMKKVSNNRTW